MLKRLRNLRDEVDSVIGDLENYPDPEEQLPGAGKTDQYTKGLEQVRDNITSLVDKLEEATNKQQEERAEKGETSEGREELRQEQSEAAWSYDATQGGETSEGGRVTAAEGSKSGSGSSKK